MNEPTAWEDINPTTALAPRPERLPACSAPLQPASPEIFRNELGACLAELSGLLEGLRSMHPELLGPSTGFARYHDGLLRARREVNA